MWNEKHNQISQMNHTVIGWISRRNGLLVLYEEQYTDTTWSVEGWFASQKAPLFIRPKSICILLTHDVLGLQFSDTENNWKQFKWQTFHLFWELQWTYDPIPAYQFV